jgi:hypothetical protein
MLMGTLSVAEAGIGRIGSIRNAFYQATDASFFPTFWGSTVSVALLLWLIKTAMTRRRDSKFAIAIAGFVTSGLLSSYVSTTDWWLQLAHFLTR